MKNILLVSSTRTLKAGQFDVCVHPLFCCVQVNHPSGWILLGYSRAADEFYVIPKKRGGLRTYPPQALSGMLELAKPWQPWRSVATWYLWRSLDPVPVEY